MEIQNRIVSSDRISEDKVNSSSTAKTILFWISIVFQSITPRKTMEIQNRIVFAVELEFTLSSLILSLETTIRLLPCSFVFCHCSHAFRSLRKKAGGDYAPSRWPPQARIQPTLG